jgi:hypothetical protein
MPDALEAQRHGLLGPFVSIEGAGRNGFTLRVRTAAVNEATLKAFRGALRPSPWLPVPVTWYGLDAAAATP